MQNKKNILIIGGGAVGTAYGCYLGTKHNITFLVRDTDKSLLLHPKGYLIENLNQHSSQEIFFNDYQVADYDSLDYHQSWDYIFITLASTALQSFSLNAINLAGSVVVLLSPGVEDLAVIQQQIALQKYHPLALVSGMISLIAYVTESEQRLTTNVYTPPMMAMPIAPEESFGTAKSEAKQAAKLVVQLFNEITNVKPKMTAKRVECLKEHSIYPNIALTCFVLGLQASGWSFQRLAEDDYRQKQILESIDALAQSSRKHHQLPRPWFLKLLNIYLLKLGLKLAPHYFTFDIQDYVKQHFLKVNEQTFVHTENYIKVAKAQSMSTTAVEQLLGDAKAKADSIAA